MNRQDERKYLINYLLAEHSEKMQIPEDENGQRRLLRSLMNVRPPKAADSDFLRIQNDYLKEETAAKGITDIADLTPVQKDIYLWQGDITTLRCDGIVNAANSQMLGCFCPCHGCIDNAIHTFSGVQLREKCAEIMQAQGYNEPAGRAKITEAYNLPCKYILHTVGPIVYGKVTTKNKKELENCYLSCLTLAEEKRLTSLAFCCLSTGEFHFPNELAAQIAVNSVKNFKIKTNSDIRIIFNVFKDLDYEIYKKLLGET